MKRLFQTIKKTALFILTILVLLCSCNNEKTFTVNGVSFKMIKVKGGEYTMMPFYEDNPVGRKSYQTKINDYYIGETEVTQELWVAVMGNNPSYNKGNMQLPVEHVNWGECQEFIKKLNDLTGEHFSLPTEAEWEYAARGGQKSHGYCYAGGNDLNTVAWYAGNSGGTTHPVATKTPNELGLYDMTGNVSEWLQDWFGLYVRCDYYENNKYEIESDKKDPSLPAVGEYLGGNYESVGDSQGKSIYDIPDGITDCHIQFVSLEDAVDSFSHLGLRLVLKKSK